MDKHYDSPDKYEEFNLSEKSEILIENTSDTCYVNDTENQDNDDLQTLRTVVPLLVPILFSIIIITGFIGNILVVCVLMRNKNMRDTTNLLILNLAVRFDALSSGRKGNATSVDKFHICCIEFNQIYFAKNKIE